MKKSTYLDERRAHWFHMGQRSLPQARERAAEDIAACEAAGFIWDPEEEDAPQKAEAAPYGLSPMHPGLITSLPGDPRGEPKPEEPEEVVARRKYMAVFTNRGLVKGPGAGEFLDLVNILANEGYVPLGPPFKADGCWVQIMIISDARLLALEVCGARKSQKEKEAPE